MWYDTQSLSGAHENLSMEAVTKVTGAPIVAELTSTTSSSVSVLYSSQCPFGEKLNVFALGKRSRRSPRCSCPTG